jgi:hypothetical protein
VCHTDYSLAIYIKKGTLGQKKNDGNSNISLIQKYIIFQKSSKNKNQNPSRDHNSMANLKFQHKPKYHVSKIIRYIKIDLLLLLLLTRGGQNPLSY